MSIAHLLMWMVATAVALAPYQWWYSLQAENSSGNEAVYLSVVTTAAYTVHGVSAGAQLFVTACLLLWRSRGLAVVPLQPGHWLAIRGAVAGVFSIVLWTAVLISGQSELSASPWLYAPRFLISFVFFFVFLRAALRRVDPARWRLTFLIMALTPLVGWIATVFSSMAYWRAGLIVPGVSSAVQALMLLAALSGDLTRSSARHWSHWLSAGLYIAGLIGSASIYFVYALSYEF
ncbi:MAG TPA: hypothetical protein VF175_19000 [Lacipirellula sp.]